MDINVLDLNSRREYDFDTDHHDKMASTSVCDHLPYQHDLS